MALREGECIAKITTGCSQCFSGIARLKRDRPLLISCGGMVSCVSNMLFGYEVQFMICYSSTVRV